MEKEHEINEYFPEKVLKKSKDKEEEISENEEDSKEWFVGDGPLDGGVKEIFVRPGKKENQEVITGAS